MKTKTWRILVCLLALGIFAVAPATLAYNDNLPSMALEERAIHDGDPDEPGPISPSGDNSAVWFDDSSRSDESTLSSFVRTFLTTFWTSMGSGI